MIVFYIKSKKSDLLHILFELLLIPIVSCVMVEKTVNSHFEPHILNLRLMFWGFLWRVISLDETFENG